FYCVIDLLIVYSMCNSVLSAHTAMLYLGQAYVNFRLQLYVLSPVENRSLVNDGESYPGRWQRSPPDPSRRGSRKKPKNSSRDCRMEKKEMRVRDLGLGFDSDEIVLFKYCMGTCLSSRKNYDLALKALTENGSISSRKVSAHPCCRPTRYETVSFMDAQTIWQTIKWLSAANCSCVG
uniref:TGF-beta family profile domain-containing protein n=1 Tax=Oncorhynchus tshawytscha TaxID=74940 RepID=A0A8C8K4C1_ONCTS